MGVQGKLIEMTGKRFGRLVVVEQAGVSTTRKALWLCRCNCGEERIIPGDGLRQGEHVSCGCHRRDLTVERNTKHGRYHSKIHIAWTNMLQRCLNPNATKFNNYGGRGITVCERWRSFENFLEDIGDPPSSNLSIDRIDVNGNYEPGNCRWATTVQQRHNRRR
jgi:hypothetical protein